jgi:uncharacterized membrane protein YfcA
VAQEEGEDLKGMEYQLVTPMEQQIAGLVALVSVALIGVQFSVTSKVWRLFERLCLALPHEEKKHALLGGLWALLPIIIIQAIFIYSRVYVPPKYSNAMFVFLMIIFALLLLFSSLITWIISKARKTKTHKANEAGLLSFLSMAIILLSIFCSISALTGVATTMLNVEVGPFGPENYTFGKWILLSAISLFFTWMLLHAYIFVKDYLKERTKRT